MNTQTNDHKTQPGLPVHTQIQSGASLNLDAPQLNTLNLPKLSLDGANLNHSLNKMSKNLALLPNFLPDGG